jgi:integrase
MGRDLPLRIELAAELERVRRACRAAGEPFGPNNFWISARRDGGIWTEHQAANWRRREFRPVVRQVASDFPQFADMARATPHATRHTFISCCLQAGISLATIAQWCGTSIQMISRTYGRMIQRYEGASPVALDEQFRTAKVEAVSLLAAGSNGGRAGAQGGSSGRLFDATATQGGSLGRKIPPPRSRKVAT